MKTIVHYYNFDISDKAAAEAYAALCVKLQDGRKCMRSYTVSKDVEHMAYFRNNPDLEIELDTKYLFSDQWNTAPTIGISDKGLRVFDWFECIWNNKNIKEGYYLDITEEMNDIRWNTYKCGYCSHMTTDKTKVFCEECLGNEYMQEKYLLLLRYMPVAFHNPKRPALADYELAYLTPLYHAAQIHGNNERSRQRIAKKRQAVKDKYKKAIECAQMEHDGFLWLMDHAFNTDNVIFYSHTQRFSFGWRKPLEKELVSKLLDVISEFHWPYEIKCQDGRILSGNIG